ncbi:MULTISPECIES: mechanosensitive ion channel family protein [Mesoflavibacter]|uniref:Mechanosensitive ion channel family protein n=1 Tax=Mesoflavibacter profundi TaxID=2708110 RepID=A0ABT4RXS7_9FLAO|nr:MULTISPECIES: mechanosensitive ion channel family protein [Mesoflavibacter]MDA0176622.1 mechanosensitive ion channel family protein [Mesoflavibacter profundi]QIJ90279.1 Potassium efflux system KefA protein / Small-conductance mechanosensitive channel [Mesoflavibacter sp. HG96]QIJ93007.1 Potassium efflux system KefA protein / Small-conductance mechanosensitive channel [Mesoflavibacter sp. HG37]
MKNQLTEAYNLLIDKLEGWFNIIVTNIPNLILAVLVLITAYFVSKYVNKYVSKLMASRVQQNSITNMVGRISAVVVVLAGLFLALGILNLSKTLTSLLAGAGVAGLAIGLALQGTLSNTFAGVVLSFRKKIQIGHWVETNGFSGEVMDINLKDFTLKEADNNIVVIPNKMILENPLKNYTLTTKMRVFLECGVGYESNLEDVERITKETICNTFDQIEKPEDVEFYYTEYGGSSINYLCRFWIDAENALEKLRAKSKAIIEIKKAYDKSEINIPFPIRTLQFDNKLSFDAPQLEDQFSNN